MNINNKIKVISSTEIELLEDAKKGDIIDLATLNKVDISFINTLVEKNKKDEYDRMLASEISKNDEKNLAKQRDLEADKDLENTKEIDELKRTYDGKINELNNEIEVQNKVKDKDIAAKVADVSKDYELRIKDLENKAKNLETEKDGAVALALSKAKSDQEKAMNDLKLENIKNIAAKEQEFNDKLTKVKEENAKLVMGKSMANVKDLGENLEQWCDAQYQEHAVDGFDNCDWYKDNEAVKDELDPNKTKGDFVFKVYSCNDYKPENILTSALLDMKDENPSATTHKKNADFYQKLNTDRIKKKCEYAILVSNLERERAVNDVPVLRVSGYEKMYVVRPEYLMMFLSLLSSLAKKYSEIILDKQVNYQNKADMISSFNEFKDFILVKSFQPLQKSLENIRKKADQVKELGQDISEECSHIIDRTMVSMQKRIERFKIEKVADAVNEDN